MIGRGYESRDLTAGSSRNASPTNHPGHPSPPPAPRLSTRRSPVSSDCLRHPPPPRHSPDTPQHRPSQPSRIPVPHSSLFIHPSCTPSPWHRGRRFARRRHHRVSVLLHRADTPGVLNGIVATLLLATSKCRRRRRRRRRRLRGRRRRQCSRLPPPSLSLCRSSCTGKRSLLRNFRLRINRRFGERRRCAVAFSVFDNARRSGSNRNDSK